MSKLNYFIQIAILVFAFVIGSFSASNAQWVSPGNGTNYTLHDLVEMGCVLHDNANGIFSITTDITISATDQLYITRDNAPFGLLFNDNDLTLTIKGALFVEGNADSHYFIGMQVYARHGCIRFEDASDPSFISYCDFANLSGIQIIGSEVSFENCKVLNFNTFTQSSAINCLNCSPVFNNCEFYSNEGAAISSPANGQSSPQILNCLFTNNVTSNANSPQINLGPGTQDSIRIVNCTINDGDYMAGGISIADLMGIGDTKILLKNNTISNNRYGYNQQGYNLSSVIVGNQFINNNLETNPMNGGSGISIYGMNTNNKAVLRHNFITGNFWGITAIYYHDIDLGNEDDWGYNEIRGNGNGGVIYDLYNNSACDIMAVGNDWGTFYEDDIEEHIFHQFDDPNLGLVTYIPFFTHDGVNDVKTTGFEVWPNPISNGLFSLVLDEARPAEVVIYNLNGQKTMSQHIENKLNTINVNALESGIYIVEVKNANKIMVKRIVIE